MKDGKEMIVTNSFKVIKGSGKKMQIMEKIERINKMM